MKTEKILVTPDLAAAYLKRNTKNRRVKNKVVEKYARIMEKGLWKKDTAEFIKFLKNGELGDGQHRLLAVIMSNTPTWLNIATGLDNDVFDVLDTGSKRNGSDTFQVAGIKNSSLIPSIISFYSALNRSLKALSKDSVETNQTKLIEYKEDPLFWQDVCLKTASWYVKFSKILPPSFIGGFYAFFYDKNYEKAESFINQLITGEGLQHKSIAILRQKLISDKLATRKMPKGHKVALVIKAWNYYNTQSKAKTLNYNSNKEKFPVAFSL